MIRVRPLSALPRGEGLCFDVEPSIAVLHSEDGEVLAVDGTRTHDVLAAHRCGAVPVGVLGTFQSRLFGRWRRQLHTAVLV